MLKIRLCTRLRLKILWKNACRNDLYTLAYAARPNQHRNISEGGSSSSGTASFASIFLTRGPRTLSDRRVLKSASLLSRDPNQPNQRSRSKAIFTMKAIMFIIPVGIMFTVLLPVLSSAGTFTEQPELVPNPPSAQHEGAEFEVQSESELHPEAALIDMLSHLNYRSVSTNNYLSLFLLSILLLHIGKVRLLAETQTYHTLNCNTGL